MSETDRAAGSIELRNRGKQEILDAISEALDRQSAGRMEFEKEGEAFSIHITT
jgi:hypothetical protein